MVKDPNQSLLASTREICSKAVSLLGRRRWLLCVGWLVLAGVIGFPLDPAVDQRFVGEGMPPWQGWAEWFSFYGDFLPGTLPLIAVLGVLGVILRHERWKRAAIATLLAAMVSGSLVSAVRISSGRTRPEANVREAVQRLGHRPQPYLSLGHQLADGEMQDGFYGFQRPAMFQSFPSGHSATSMATATTLVVVLPELGVVLVPVALGVCWSRLYLHKHHFSDVLVGATAGVIGGLLFGGAERRARGARLEASG